MPLKLAVLTSGGDSAGMNAAVRAVVRGGILRGCDTWIVREGYEGLVLGNTETLHADGGPVDLDLEDSELARRPIVQHLRFGDGPLLVNGQGDASLKDQHGRSLKGRYIIRVGWDDVRGWLSEGGTLIGTARSKTFRTAEGRLSAAHNLIREGIDALVVCGGDGSLTGADKLREEWPSLVDALLQKKLITKEQADRHQHLRIAGLVGSIDNDMAKTDMTIGASTALHRICEAIDNIHTTASSHSRAFVIEVMGRHCGWLACLSGVSSGADFIFIPEQPVKASKWKNDMCATINAHRSVGKRKTIIIVAEGAIDDELHPITASEVKDVLADQLGLDTRVTTLGHTQRGGRPCAADRILATLQGVEAVNAILEATPETPSYMIGVLENKITRVPLVDAVETTKAVAKAIEAKDFKTAMSLRDPEFAEFLQAFDMTSTLNEPMLAKEKKTLTIAIMHTGAPAGGMNAATRTAVRFCANRGYTALAIHNGFKGLIQNLVVPLSWLEVDSWVTRGGSELGTNRTLPDIDLTTIASRFEEHKMDALFIIGGFEAFTALRILEDGREQHSSFRIPIALLPATISNNVPLTEFSLGSDTSINALIDACDAIKQSASASRNRVFVVETQGGQCGYIATMGALAAGAVIVYTPEVGIRLGTLQQDLDALKRRYQLDVKGKSEGRLVIRSERSSNIYSTDLITSILKEEGAPLFDARLASLGHTLQGGIPSPLDRSRAVRLATKCMAFLEEHASQRRSAASTAQVTQDDSGIPAVMIAIQGTSIAFTPAREVVEYADMKNRRGKNTWWERYKALAEELGGLPQLR